MSTLLVAATGGHLKQLHRLHRRLTGLEQPVRWATFDTPQSRSLLEGETVDYVRYIGSRDPVNAARALPDARRVVRRAPPDVVFSTGSAIALPFFAAARARGISCHYIESAARSDGPSLTGKIIRRTLPGVRLYTQYAAWADDDWRYRGSVFDSFERGAPNGASRAIRRAVVTLGTFRGHGFARLVRRLIEVLPSEVEVLWQTGETDVSSLGIDGHYAIPERDLTDAMREADVVVAHAGVGTSLASLEVGKSPLLVPRRRAFAEHVDDHQLQIARELAGRGLAVTVDADDLRYEDLELAAAGRVVSVRDEPSFVTEPGRARGFSRR